MCEILSKLIKLAEEGFSILSINITEFDDIGYALLEDKEGRPSNFEFNTITREWE